MQSPNLSSWFTEALQWLPPVPGPLGSPAPGSQSRDLQLPIESTHCTSDEKMHRAQDPSYVSDDNVVWRRK